MLSPAIEHAERSTGELPDYEIFAWDSASSGCELPFMLAQHIQILKRDWGTYLDSRGGIPHLSGTEIFSTMHLGARGVSLSVYHSGLRQALFWTDDASLIPYYEQGAPFRTILNWMLNDNNHILIHAGAVGLPNSGVLLAGKGGSGKSVSALACLQAGLLFTSDDYCLVTLGEMPKAHCLYNTAKLVGPVDIDRFPSLADKFELHDQLDPKSKPMVFLHDHIPEQVINRLPLQAIFLPHVNQNTHTFLHSARPAAALAAIAPNSIFQLPEAGKSTVASIARLCRDLPCYWLEVGQNLDEIGLLVSDFLTHC